MDNAFHTSCALIMLKALPYSGMELLDNKIIQDKTAPQWNKNERFLLLCEK